MLSFKQMLESYDRKQQKQNAVTNISTDQNGFLFSRLMKMKNREKQHKSMHFTMDNSNSFCYQHLEEANKSYQNTENENMPSSIASNQDFDESIQNEEWLENNEKCMMKCKEDMRNHEKGTENTELQDFKEILSEYESEFEMYKIEKANLIADMHEKTGRPVHLILPQILKNLKQEIKEIILSKSHLQTHKKQENRTQATLDTPSCWDIKSNEQNSSGDNKKLSPPQKIIQFTLGNHQNSGSTSNKKTKSGECEDVSQFFGGRLNVPTSKQIKNRVMKGNNKNT